MKNISKVIILIITIMILGGCANSQSESSNTTTDNEVSETSLELNEDSLKKIAQNVLDADGWVEFKGSGYVDWEGETYIDGDKVYYPVNDEEITSITDLKAYLSNSFSSSVVDEIVDNGDYVEVDGQLYVYTIGFGGFGTPIIEVEANGNNEDGYDVTFYYSGLDDDMNPTYIEDHSQTFHMIIEDNKYVFAEVVKLGIANLDENCLYVVD